MSVKEIICPRCGEGFFRIGRRWKYCSRVCWMSAQKQLSADSEWAKRLHDGARLQSDDFGEQDGDNSVTFQ